MNDQPFFQLSIKPIAVSCWNLKRAPNCARKGDLDIESRKVAFERPRCRCCRPCDAAGRKLLEAPLADARAIEPSLTRANDRAFAALRAIELPPTRASDRAIADPRTIEPSLTRERSSHR